MTPSSNPRKGLFLVARCSDVLLLLAVGIEPRSIAAF